MKLVHVAIAAHDHRRPAVAAHAEAEMLAFAGVPFIMGNACEELKSNGWRRTCSNDENGVAAALDQVLGNTL